MQDYASWTKEKLAEDPVKTQAGLARFLGLNKSAVSRMLSGERKITAAELDKIVAYLEVPHPRGFAEPAASYDSGETMMNRAPIYTARSGPEPGQWLIDRQSQPIDSRPKAVGFETAVKLFGIYAPDDAMAPRFKTGEIVWVDPARPASSNDDVLLLNNTSGEPEEIAILGELSSVSDGQYHYTQHKFGQVKSVAQEDWRAWRVLPRL